MFNSRKENTTFRVEKLFPRANSLFAFFEAMGLHWEFSVPWFPSLAVFPLCVYNKVQRLSILACRLCVWVEPVLTTLLTCHVFNFHVFFWRLHEFGQAKVKRCRKRISEPLSNDFAIKSSTYYIWYEQFNIVIPFMLNLALAPSWV